jgi:hypothetical protein
MGWLRRRRFAKAFRAKLDENRETLDPREYAKSRAATYSGKKMKALMGQLETAPGLKGGIQDWDWEAIMAWIQDFLIPLIKTLLPLLVLLDEE